MESHGLHVLEFIESELKKLTENPEIYVEPQPEKAEKFKALSEKSYRTAFNCNKNLKGKFLPKLLIDGFEAEQIFQQCELLSKAALPKISRTVSNLNPKDITDAVFKTKNHSVSSTSADKSTVKSPSSIFSGDEAEEDYAFDDDSDSFDEMEEAVRNKFSTKDSKKPDEENSSVDEDNFPNDEGFSAEEENDFDEDSDAINEDSDLLTIKETGGKQKPFSKPRTRSYHSEVDDKFFKLSELDEYLKIEDIKEERKNEQDSDPDIDDDIDLFQDIPSDEQEEEDFDEEKLDSKKSSRDFMYDDFFDEPQSNARRKDNLEESVKENDYRNDFSDEMDSAPETKDLEEGDDSEEEAVTLDENKNLKKSAFELEQEKTRKKIQEYEKSLLEPLPWHLTGEVDASKRPADSLIHKDTEFDSNVKQDLLVDSTLNEKIENITIMAIRNEAYNDVERKFKPTEDVVAYKAAVALEQTKSKKGLAEVYEEEFLKKQNQNKQEEEEEPKHKEIKKLMDTLFPELYALFSHIPIPAVPELKIVRNLPAVTVEEVAPTKVSDATLLAPEEVKKKSGLIKSQTERTETDRKRERRKKKIHQKLKEKKRLEKLESQKGNPSAKQTRLEKIQALKKIKQHKNTKIAAVDDGGKVKSSKDFFSRLQDTVISKNKSKPVNTTKKKKNISNK